MNRWLGILGCAASVATAACGEPVTPPMAVSALARPIINGTADTNPAHQAVVALTTSYGQFCSGTLITDTVVITAAHCLEGSVPNRTEVFFGADVSVAGETRPVEEWAIFPAYNSTLFLDDLGVIRLQSAAPTGIAPIPHLPTALRLTTADAGAAVDYSGFGMTETDSHGVKLHITGTIALVCPGPGSCDNGWVSARTFKHDQSDGGPCYGDSGGPAFLFRDLTEYVAGVTAYGDVQCSEFGVSTTVSEYADWVESFISGASLEDCDNGVDDDDDLLVDCDDSDCAYHSACTALNACATAKILRCGSTRTSTTDGGSRVMTTNSCITDPSLRWSGTEVAFVLDVPAEANVSVHLQPTTGNADLFALPGDSETCDIRRCLAASTAPEGQAELVLIPPGSGVVYLVVDTFDLPSSFDLSVTCTGTPELCANVLDDDGDGLVDCADPDCAGAAACRPVPEVCYNRYDDDGDGFIDCADSECSTYPDCLQPPPDDGSGNVSDPPWVEDEGCRAVAGDGRVVAVLAASLLLARRRRQP